MNNITELKAQLAEANKTKAEAKASKLEQLKLEAQLRMATNVSLAQQQAQLEYEDQIVDELVARAELAREAVASEGLTNKRGSRIQFNAYGLDGYGKPFELVTGITSGLIYTREDARTVATVALGISPSLVARLTGTFMSRPRWDAENEVIDLGRRGDMEEYLNLLNLLATGLDLAEIPVSGKPTQEVFDRLYEDALAKAEIEKEEHNLAVAEWDKENHSLVQQLAEAHK